MSALRSLGTLVRQAGQALESFGAYLQGSGPELGTILMAVHPYPPMPNAFKNTDFQLVNPRKELTVQ